MWPQEQIKNKYWPIINATEVANKDELFQFNKT